MNLENLIVDHAKEETRPQYALCDTIDPEERLEDAVMALALHRASGGNIALTKNKDDAMWGRNSKPYADEDWVRGAYFETDVFKDHARREFLLTDLEGAEDFARGRQRWFIKSMRPKWTRLCEGDFAQAMDAMVYSFCDRKACLLVQDAVKVERETRVFVIDRSIVTHGKIEPWRTPIDHHVSGLPQSLYDVAADFAERFPSKMFAVDVAFLDGEPGCVEVNPFVPGKTGLYDCDVLSLAQAAWTALQPLVSGEAINLTSIEGKRI